MIGEEAAGALPEGAELLTDGSGRVEYTLRWPVKYRLGDAEQLLDKVVVRRKTGADNLAIKSLVHEAEIAQALIQRLTGVTRQVAEQFDDVDIAAIGEIVMGFTRPGRTTGSGAPG